jgi:hypothetical protein
MCQSSRRVGGRALLHSISANNHDLASETTHSSVTTRAQASKSTILLSRCIPRYTLAITGVRPLRAAQPSPARCPAGVTTRLRDGTANPPDGPLQAALQETTTAATIRAAEGQKTFSPIAAFLDKH